MFKNKLQNLHQIPVYPLADSFLCSVCNGVDGAGHHLKIESRKKNIKSQTAVAAAAASTSQSL